MDRPERSQQALIADAVPGSGGGPEPGTGAGSAPPAEGNGLAVEACVVLPSSGEGARYGMFEALALSSEGATLAGGLLLEVGEEVTFELRLPDRTVFRAPARVVEIVRGLPPAMKVVWLGVGEGEGDRHLLPR